VSESNETNQRTEEIVSDGYSVAVMEDDLERMKNDPRIRVTDHTGMGPMSEFDVFVSFGIVAGRNQND